MSKQATTQREIPVVDAHFHLWDLRRNYHPWLCDDPLIAHRYGDHRRICRDYLPEDYLRDSSRFDVQASVYVETEWDPDDPIGETRWICAIADRHGFPDAVVAQAWLDRDDVEDVLGAQAAFPRVRSVRHKPSAAPSPQAHAAPTPQAVRAGSDGSMSDEKWRRGYALLADHDLDFDLQIAYWHFDQAYELARDFPATRIILNHTGLPADRSEAGLAEWRRAMRRLARAPNVAVKISGLGEPGVPWSATANGPIVLDTIDIFGVDRCMFASNFPVDSLVADFDTIFGGFMQIVAHLPTSDRRKLFCDNAKRIYRID